MEGSRMLGRRPGEAAPTLDGIRQNHSLRSKSGRVSQHLKSDISNLAELLSFTVIKATAENKAYSFILNKI